MRILLISYLFAPFNASGSIRVTKLAEFLVSRGYDVRVLTCDRLNYPTTLTTSFPYEYIVRTHSVNLDGWMQYARRSAFARKRSISLGVDSSTQSRLRNFASAYRAIVGFPDAQVFWAPFAIAAGLRMFQSWLPDIVFSSALPFTAHLIGSQLSKVSGAAWIADYRDLFVGNPYQQCPAWRTWLDRKLEFALLKRAQLLTTVSSPLVNQLSTTLKKEVVEIRNGFDPADLLLGVPSDSPRSCLRILHTGIIYPGRRDPSPLFKAVMNAGLSKDIAIEFVGQDNRGIKELSERYQIEDSVTIREPVSYRESIRLQAGSDVLLLLLGLDSADRGIFTGKFFEYVAAGRPILCIGSPDNEAARAIIDNNLGVVASASAPIAAALTRWRDMKLVEGELKVGGEGLEKFSRISQFEILEDNLARFIH